jgi:hypothetical protein
MRTMLLLMLHSETLAESSKQLMVVMTMMTVTLTMLLSSKKLMTKRKMNSKMNRSN